MLYSTPKLVVLGQAPVLVLGWIAGTGDRGTSVFSLPPPGLALGLD
jgi:hypothetical protein